MRRRSQQLIEAAVSNAPAGVTAAEVQRLVQGAISAAVANAPTGVTAAEIQQAVENSVRQAAAGQLTAAEVQGIVDASIRSLPAPQVDTGQLRGLVQAAVQESVPKGTSAEEIRRMVEAAVTGATAGGVTRGDMEALITKSVIDVAAGQLSTSDVEKIVAASLSATERAIEATEKAVAEAGMAAMAAQKAAEKAVEEAQMAAAAAMPAPVAMATTPAGCFIKGDKVSDCPLRSPHTWQAPLVASGEFPSYANYQGPRPTKFYESPMSYQLVKQGKASSGRGTPASPRGHQGPSACRRDRRVRRHLPERVRRSTPRGGYPRELVREGCQRHGLVSLGRQVRRGERGRARLHHEAAQRHEVFRRHALHHGGRSLCLGRTSTSTRS